jgi:hypothetical protein
VTSWLVNYCCSQDGLFIIPIEALSPAGIEPSYSDALTGKVGLSSNWITQFNRAYALYWKRAESLSARSPGYWFPPRLQHIAIVTRPKEVRPYFQPFHKNSWLLYQHDFDPEYSTIEFSVFQFFQAERMGLLEGIVPALHANLPYFLTLSGQQRKEFRSGCKRTDRPDAEAWRSLGHAQSWLKSLYHETFRPPKLAVPGMRIHRENGLIVPPSETAKLAVLQDAWGDSARQVLGEYRTCFSRNPGDSSDGLAQWLEGNRPRALISGGEGEILWDPERADECDKLRGAVGALTPGGDQRIRRDLEIIDRHSRRFLASLCDPEALAEPAPYMTEGGLCYIHGEHRLIAYDIGPGRNENRLWEPSPPFERLMLGARTIHEWGHLAAESGWVVIPQNRLAERQALTERLARLFDQVLAGASGAVRRLTRDEDARLSARHGSFGQGLSAAMLRRIEDYMANLVARRFLSADEMDTYVRNNVASRVTEYGPGRVYLQLIRLVYEYQYLSLSQIENPRKWFFDSTWIGPLFIDRGVVSRSQFEEIVETVSGICSCYEVDETRFDFTAVTSGSATD